MLAAAFDSSRAPTGVALIRMFSDAALEGTNFPAVCGNLYRYYWILPFVGKYRELPVVCTEFAGPLINLTHDIRSDACRCPHIFRD